MSNISPDTLNGYGLHRVGGPDHAQAHVVFVHGLGGKGYATWARQARSTQTFWPTWVGEDFEHVQVWIYAYDAAPTLFTGDPMPVFDRARNLRSSLQAQGLLDKPLVFVVHSLGGLVAKKLVVDCAKDAPLTRLGGVLFLATPHHGAELALLGQWISRLWPLRMSVLIEELTASHPAARELHTDYLRLERQQGFSSYCAMEKKRTVLGFKVVSEASAHPGDPSWDWRPCDEDHFGIAKPTSREGDLYAWYRMCIQNLIAKARSRPVVQGLAPNQPEPIGLQESTPLQAQLTFAPRCINIPPSIGTRFVGRDAELTQLHQALQAKSGQDVALSSYALHGMGGYGKTRLVVEYAHRYGDEYSCVLLLKADSLKALEADLAALCLPQRLDLGVAHGLPDGQTDRANLAKRWLVQHPGWLLIADNTDASDAAVAVAQLARDCPQGRVLATTRLADWGGTFATLPLSGLPPEAARQLLLQQSAPGRVPQIAHDEADLAAIVTALHGHSLALTMAATYIRQRRISFGRYLNDLYDQQQQPLNWLPHSALADYDKSVVHCLRFSIDSASPTARKLLDCLAWLAPEPLPASLLDTAFDGVPDLRGALAELVQLHLVEEGGIGPYVHRLLQEVLRVLQSNAASGTARSAHMLPGWQTTLQWVNTAFQGEPSDVAYWPVLLPLAAHVDTLTAAVAHIDASQFAEQPFADVVARLCNRRGLLHQSQAEFSEAEALYRRALAMSEASYGGNHPAVAIRLNNLAGLLHATNFSAEAEPLYRRALAIDEAAYGENHSEVAADLNNLAGLLSATNRLAEAEPLYRRALAINEGNFGECDPTVATSLNNLASLLKSTERSVEAEPLYRRALSIREASYGESHPTVASSLNNLANLLKFTERLAEAEALYRRALSINEASYGENHPSVATSLNNLAGLLHVTNRLPEAETLHRRALAINEASYGAVHPKVATSLNNLASVLKLTQRLSEAEPLNRRALAIFVDFTVRTSHVHPQLGVVVTNYVGLLKALQLPNADALKTLQSVLAPLLDDPRFFDLLLSLLKPTE